MQRFNFPLELPLLTAYLIYNTNAKKVPFGTFFVLIKTVYLFLI